MNTPEVRKLQKEINKHHRKYKRVELQLQDLKLQLMDEYCFVNKLKNYLLEEDNSENRISLININIEEYTNIFIPKTKQKILTVENHLQTIKDAFEDIPKLYGLVFPKYLDASAQEKSS